jgi:competence protein ComEC
MAVLYVQKTTSRLFEASKGSKFLYILIFGEEVEVLQKVENGRVNVRYREKYFGWVTEKDLASKPSLELYFIDVGQGDATFIVTPGRKKILIDGGYNEQAMNFLAWKYQLSNMESPPVEIDLLVLSHGDEDHIGGLMPLLLHPKINVKKVVHNGIAIYKSGSFKTDLGDLDTTGKFLLTRHDSLSDLDGKPLSRNFGAWAAALKSEGVEYAAIHDEMHLDLGEKDISIDIFGPRVTKLDSKNVLKWFGNKSYTINGHSVVLRLNYKRTSLMLSGDLNIEGSKFLMESSDAASRMAAHILKSPHHGSHEFYTPFLEAVKPQVSVISSGDSPDHGHPRANFLAAVGLASRSKEPLLFSTEIAATFVDANEADIKSMLNKRSLDSNSLKRTQLFKKRLNGMINVRTDGQNLYAARRVNASYQWESYGPLLAEPFPGII